MGPPFSGRVCVVRFRTQSERSLYLNYIPSSFGMRSPFGSSVVLGPHLIMNEGFSWKLARIPSGWGHPFSGQVVYNSIAIEGIPRLIVEGSLLQQMPLFP